MLTLSMKEIVLSLAIFVSKCLSFFVSRFCLCIFSPLNIYTSNDRHCLWHGHVWPKKVTLSPIYLGQKLTCDVEKKYTWGRWSYRAILKKKTTLGSSADAQAARTRTLRIILVCKENLFTFIPVWILKVANCKIVTVAILQAVMSLVTLSQCWLIIFQDKWCIDNIEII